MERQSLQAGSAVPRYTLTYSEGTLVFFQVCWVQTIYPHIQWGNLPQFSQNVHKCDIPSHTVRELLNPECLASGKRYTLTYSEGTRAGVSGMELDAIYPHIQWGNFLFAIPSSSSCDIPSHTVRELKPLFVSLHNVRYTLTYSEGTQKTAHGFPVCLDIPSHTVREHSVFMRLSAAPNTSLCNLHKSLLSSSSHI